MSKLDKNVLNTEKAENLDDAHAAIGRVASLLLKAGRPLELAGLSELLKQRAGQATDSLLKKDYHDALGLIAAKMHS